MSPIRVDAEPHRRCAEVDGAAMEVARQRTERTYPELIGSRSRAKLVVLEGEIVGRFSVETQTFIRLLARAKTRAVPGFLGCTDGVLSWLALRPRFSWIKNTDNTQTQHTHTHTTPIWAKNGLAQNGRQHDGQKCHWPKLDWPKSVMTLNARENDV